MSEFNLDDKIFSVSFDNASTNTQAIRGIKNDLPLVLKEYLRILGAVLTYLIYVFKVDLHV